MAHPFGEGPHPIFVPNYKWPEISDPPGTANKIGGDADFNEGHSGTIGPDADDKGGI